VPVAAEIFARLMPGDNQLDRLRDDVEISRDDLLEVHQGARTEAGLRENIRVGVQYIEAWLGGRGAVPLYNLMEDAATAEISRVQTWQWLHQGAQLDDGRKVTPELFESVMGDEMAKVRAAIGEEAYGNGRFAEAEKLFAELVLRDDLEEFLTVPAYELIR
jgi:malate synthase